MTPPTSSSATYREGWPSGRSWRARPSKRYVARQQPRRPPLPRSPSRRWTATAMTKGSPPEPLPRSGPWALVFPPSVTLVIYGLLTETSIGKLFLAGMIPGLLIAFSFAVDPFRLVQDQSRSSGRKAKGPHGRRGSDPSRPCRGSSPSFFLSWAVL